MIYITVNDPTATVDAIPTPSLPVIREGAAPVISVPGGNLGEHFVERIQYPVRQGEPDPGQNWGDLYLPGGGGVAGSVPLVVFVHGGAWHKGATGTARLADRLAERGVAVFNVEYRDIDLGGGWPTTFTDVADAVDLIPYLGRRHPEIALDDVTVAGHSAGAQLATWAGTRGDLNTHGLGRNPRFVPDRVVSLSGPLDLVWAADNGDRNIVRAMKGTPSEKPAQYKSVDPIQNINRGVPVIAVHGRDDGLVPPANSEHYVEAVKNLHGRAELILLDGEDHVSFLQESSAHFDTVLGIIDGTAVPVPR
ncbi:alpha/beta hydrolase family protein [Corynebacterium pacaense]|uniref:alpha/beta hydrolase family protein n=1 Tax=Corynebacterium pacaense TaxID=1816684 RepID=UPI0009BB0FA7|nr:alpha/beta fold hydrolase [Corynebacterium pacaense]